MKVIYIDSLFFINLAVNYLLVLATAKLCALRANKLRLLLAALFGALYAVAAVLPSLPSFIGSVPIRLAAGVLLALIAFGSQRGFLRHTLIFFGLAACFAGVSLLVGHVSARTLLITVVLTYAVISAVFKFAAARKPSAKTATSELTITLGGRTVALTVLNDSGNALRDPLDGSVTPVINYDRVRDLLPAEARVTLDSALSVSAKYEALFNSCPLLAPRLTPYRAIGTDAGLLLTLKADAIISGGSPLHSTRFAISPTPINYFGGIL